MITKCPKCGAVFTLSPRHFDERDIRDKAFCFECWKKYEAALAVPQSGTAEGEKR